MEGVSATPLMFYSTTYTFVAPPPDIFVDTSFTKQDELMLISRITYDSSTWVCKIQLPLLKVVMNNISSIISKIIHCFVCFTRY